MLIVWRINVITDLYLPVNIRTMQGCKASWALIQIFLGWLECPWNFRFVKHDFLPPLATIMMWHIRSLLLVVGQQALLPQRIRERHTTYITVGELQHRGVLFAAPIPDLIAYFTHLPNSTLLLIFSHLIHLHLLLYVRLSSAIWARSLYMYVCLFAFSYVFGSGVFKAL